MSSLKKQYVKNKKKKHILAVVVCYLGQLHFEPPPKEAVSTAYQVAFARSRSWRNMACN